MFSMYTQIQQLSFLDFKPRRVFGSLKCLHAKQFIRKAKCISETFIKYIGSVLFLYLLNSCSTMVPIKNCLYTKRFRILLQLTNENNFNIKCKLDAVIAIWG